MKPSRREHCVVISCSQAEIAECRLDSSVRSSSPAAQRGLTQLDCGGSINLAVDPGQWVAKHRRQPGNDRDCLIRFTSG